MKCYGSCHFGPQDLLRLFFFKKNLNLVFFIKKYHPQTLGLLGIGLHNLF